MKNLEPFCALESELRAQVLSCPGDLNRRRDVFVGATRRDDVFGNAIGKILLLGIGAHVRERQYSE